MTRILTESNDLSKSLEDATFDDENLVIRGVSLTYYKSRNGRIYGEGAMSDLRQLSEGANVYEDDHIKRADSKHGKFTELGIVRNVTGDALRNRGDIHLMRSHPRAEQFFELAKLAKQGDISEPYALSHEATKCETDGGKPERIHNVGACKGFIVTKTPGTNTTLFEEHEMSVSLESLKADDPEGYRTLLEEAAATLEEPKSGKDEEYRQLLKEHVALQGKHETLEAELNELKKEKADAEAAKAAEAKTESLLETLTEAAKAGKRDVSDAMKKNFVRLYSDQDVVSEEEVKEFVESLPLLVDDGKPVEEPTPGSRSGTEGGAPKRRVSALSRVSHVTAKYRGRS